MRFFSALVAGVAVLASSVAAQSTKISFTKVPSSVTVGTAVTIEYKVTDTTVPVTILLRKGASTDLKTIETLTSTSTGGSFSWTPSSSLASGTDYALQITQGSEINYSNLFAVTGGSASSAVTSASSGVATVTSTLVSANRTITSSSLVSASTHSSNTTITSASLTSLATSATASGSRTASSTASGSSSAPTTGGASGLSSPLALVFGAIVAIAVLN